MTSDGGLPDCEAGCGSRVRLLELFSGIGGMRLALSYAGIDVGHAVAVDVSDQAIAVYAHNFGDQGIVRRDLTGLTVNWFEQQQCRIWTMSPPCQPHSRQGKCRDLEDPRSKPLLHIISVLQRIPTPPEVLILENVQNFERSDSCAKLLEALAARDFHWRCFLVSPTQFGFPNSRQRFYLVAKRRNKAFTHVPDPELPSGDVLPDVPCIPISHVPCPAASFGCQGPGGTISVDAATDNPGLTTRTSVPSDSTELCGSCGREVPPGISWESHDGVNCASRCFWRKRRIGDFIEYPATDVSLWEIPEETLKKESARCFDTVSDGCQHSLCFTKAYGRYVDGTGSVYKMSRRKAKKTKDGEDFTMREFFGVLRYFSPSEVARLLGFKLRDPDAIGDSVVCQSPCLPACTSHGNAEAGPCLCLPYSLPSLDSKRAEEQGPKIGRAFWGMLGNSLNPQVVAYVCAACEVREAVNT